MRDGRIAHVSEHFNALIVQEKMIPLSDGAGEVVAVGEGVKEFAVGDAVVSTFHPK